MTTAAHSHHQPYQPPIHSHLGLAGVEYETDDAGPGGSPLMKPYIPKIAPSPSPPLGIPAAKVSLSPSPVDGFYHSNRHKIRHSTGDAVLVSYLDNGRRPEIARAAGFNLATSDDFADSEDESDNGDQSRRHLDNQRRAIEGDFYRHEPSGLQQVAAGALQQVASGEPGHDISVSTRKLSLADNGPALAVHAPSPTIPYPTRRVESFGRVNTTMGGRKSSPELLTPADGELPPLQMDSPRYDGNGQSLPSIRSQFGNFSSLHADKDLTSRHAGPGSLFPRSPSTGIPRLHPPISQGGQVSPPTSPNDTFSRGPSSATSPYAYGGSNMQHRPSTDYSSSTAGETPSTDQSVSTPATSVADRMSIDGITNPSQGNYACTVPGCTAPPFQTQYLLNSHANVHSSARPHYCPVPGCPRSETGKGFKRKNEMIRHGLVHESPGYVCPFCPERDHKYPRPDNLQR
jgi:hypothetical protein